MSVVIRGTKNALRNPIRSGSVILMLGVVVAFALSLLLANQAVKAKIDNLKSSGATTLTIRPAGNFGPQGGGEPLTSTQLDEITGLDHVAQTSAQLEIPMGFRVRAGADGSINASSEAVDNTPQANISLESSITPGTLGIRQFGGTTAEPPKLPVRISGVVGALDESAQAYKLTSGGYFSADDAKEALVGTSLATKNNLNIGSTFTAYAQTFKVVGIFDSGTEFGNDAVKIPLKTLQTLANRPGEVSMMIVQVDSIDNIDAVQSAINNKLGSGKVDITSSAQNTQDAIASLKSIQRISVTGVLIAAISGVVIVFLVMIMVVRERKREIAVLKAIGASNVKISLQFVAESLTLTVLSLVVGVVLALSFSGKLTQTLVATNSKSSQPAGEISGTGTVSFTGPGGGNVAVGRGAIGLRAGRGFRLQNNQPSAKDLLTGIKTDLGVVTIAEGVGLVLLIGALGSALPAFVIAKIRPSEVLRGE